MKTCLICGGFYDENSLEIVNGKPCSCLSHASSAAARKFNEDMQRASQSRHEPLLGRVITGSLPGQKLGP